MRDYNTSRSKLILPEYGRNIQKMVDHIVQLPTKAERNEAAAAVVSVMGAINPHLRETNDYKRKLWDHLAIMSDFKLDIDYPYELPEKASFEQAPNAVPYPSNHIKFRHYGKIIESMIAEAIAMEDGEEKDYLKLLIANFIKRSYLTWNCDTVDDETILKELNELSDGKLTLNESVRLLDNPNDNRNFRGKSKSGQNKNRKRKVYRNNSRNFS